VLWTWKIVERRSDKIFMSTTAHKTLYSAKNNSVKTDDAVIPTGTLACVVAIWSWMRWTLYSIARSPTRRYNKQRHAYAVGCLGLSSNSRPAATEEVSHPATPSGGSTRKYWKLTLLRYNLVITRFKFLAEIGYPWPDFAYFVSFPQRKL